MDQHVGRQYRRDGVALSKEMVTDGLPPWLWLIAPLGLAAILVFVAHASPQFYERWLDDESRGLLSAAHVIIPVIAIVVAVRMLNLKMLRDAPWLCAWVAIAAVGAIYLAGEEASWGQHYIGWETPDAWSVLNDQGETNLHNISSWFDQKPRLILEIGIIVGGILVPIYAYFRPAIRQSRFAIILPPAICLPTALLAEISMGSERVIDLWDGGQFIFSRASEVQETYFYFFILLYLLVLSRRIRAYGYRSAPQTGVNSARTILD